MTVQPFDTFNRAAGALGTSSSGHLWTLRETGPYAADESSQAQITSVITLNGSGQAVAGDTTHVHFATLDHGSGDGTWEMGLSGSPGNASGLGIVFRWQDATHYWHAFIYDPIVGADNLLFLERQNGSTFASASPRTSATIPPPTAADVLKVVATGSSIEVFVNDVSYLTATNSSFASATHHGISFYFTTGGIDWFGRPNTLWTVGRGRIGERSGLWH